MSSPTPTFYRFSLAFLLVILTSGHGALAQNAPSSVRQSISTLAWETPVSELYYLNNGRVEELKAYSGGFSMPFTYEGDPNIYFYADKESLALEPKDRPAPVGIAKLNPSLKHTLLIFIKKDKGHYQIMSHDFSQEEFPPQSCRIFNFSDLRVVFAFGDQPKAYTVDPHDVMVVRQDGLADKNQMVKVQVAQDDEEGLRLVYRSSWRFDDQCRSSVFILPAKDSHSSVKMKKFVERGLKPKQVSSQ